MPATPTARSMAPPADRDSPDRNAGIERGHPDVSTHGRNHGGLARPPRPAVLAQQRSRRLVDPGRRNRAGEDPADVAQREFREELGSAAGKPLRALGEIRQRGGRRVIAFAVEGNLDDDAIRATSSKWNGGRKAGADRAFRRSIVRSGLIWRGRETRFSPASNRFSNGSMKPDRQLI
jgi:predicted NUDIX family NTP pyrophosphohydrolase